MGVRWYGSNAGSCGYYASQRRMSLNNALNNVAVTSITRTASGHYIGTGGGGASSSSSCPSTSQTDVYNDLKARSETGRGITKQDLREVAEANIDGSKVSQPAKNAIKQALAEDLFATKIGAKAAKSISQAGSLSIVGIRLKK